MQKGENCLGCQRSFEEGTNLPLQDLTIELKNYSFPIRDQKHKWILLKTIVSLLNSKGGIIFVGAEDKTGEIVGLSISRKQQDEFKLFIQKLVERIQPSVDLSNREDIMMQFVPVTRGGAATGKYLGKIIVKQGVPSKLYCFSQKVVLQTVSDKKYDEFDVVYSFKRINMGSVKQLQGYDVVIQAAARAVNPPKEINIFHEGCNPEPLNLPVQSLESRSSTKSQPSPKQGPRPAPNIPAEELEMKIEENEPEYAIQFFKIKDVEAREKLEDTLEQYLNSIGARSYTISYEEQTDTLLVEFTKKDQWEQALDLIDGGLDKLNEALKGHASFVKKQAESDYALYENQRPLINKCPSGQVCQLKEQEVPEERRSPSGSKKYVEKSPQKKEGVSVSPPKIINKSDSIEQEIKKNQGEADEGYKIKLTSEKKETRSLYTKGKFVSLPSSVDISESLVLSITHLNPSRKAQLIQYVQSLSKCNKKVDQYDKTLEFHFDKQEDFNQVHDKLQKSKDLTKFGFRGLLRFGVNTGQITFENYDKKKYKEFKDFITKFVGNDLKRCEFTKKGTKYSLLLTLKSPAISAKWLDKIIQNQEVKSFRIPGGNESLKMKIDLVCVRPTTKLKEKAEQ